MKLGLDIAQVLARVLKIEFKSSHSRIQASGVMTTYREDVVQVVQAFGDAFIAKGAMMLRIVVI